MSTPRVVSIVSVAGVIAVTSCKGAPGRDPEQANNTRARAATDAGAPAAAAAAAAPSYHLRPVLTVLPSPPGVSDVTRDGAGTYWIIPERAPAGPDRTQHEILPLTVAADGGAPALGPAKDWVHFTLPPALDSESVTALEGGTFLVGTEGDNPGAATEAIFLVNRDGGAVPLAPTLSYEPWGIRSERNHGIEALCAVGGRALVAVEQRIVVEGRAYAPLAILDLASKQQTSYRLQLHTQSGRISALACRDAGGDVEALAVERNRGPNNRVLSFRLRAEAHTGVQDVSSTILVNLEEEYARYARAVPGAPPVLPNVEGIAWLEGGTIGLVTDNQNGSVLDGDTLWFVLEPPVR